MNESISFTDAIDALDENDPFDANVRVGFRRTLRRGTLQRETVDDSGGLRGSANWLDVGDWEHVRNELELGLDVGIFRDVMLFGRLPLVLSDQREIVYPNGATGAVDTILQEPSAGRGMHQLYYMPFRSPTRSGIDSLRVGFAANPMNQARRPHLPTWLLSFELDLGIGEIMNACEDDQLERDPRTGEVTRDADGRTTPIDCSAGVSRGTHAFEFQSRLSRRYRHAEVFSSLLFRFEWAGRADKRFSPSGSLAGYQHQRPPVRGALSAGIAFIPWENRESWQRFSIDLRVTGTYVSEGRDYSPLYDALGSSQNRHLTVDNLEGVPADPGNPGGLRRVAFNGLTDVEAHGEFGGQFAIEMQASRYIRFRFGVDVAYITPHVITFTDGCDPGASSSGMGDPRNCDSSRPDEGLINPHHRPVIDRPGNRFRLDGGVALDLFVTAAAQF